jgi:Cd2+/Zn2+-exporting ATPase
MAMTDTVQLELSVLLPEVDDGGDACVARLHAAVGALPGVERVHIAAVTHDAPARLCIHYDRHVMSLPEVRRTARQAGARISDEIGHVVWNVEGITNERRARTIADRLARAEGVLEATARAGGVVRVEFERARIDEATLAERLRALGARVRDGRTGAGASAVAGEVALAPHGHDGESASGDHEGHAHDHGGVFGERTEVVFALAAGAAYLAGLLVGWLTDLPEGTSIALYVAAYGFGGFFAAREAVDTIRAGRFEVDFLMLVAAAGAAALGRWAEGAVLLFLFSLGHALEHYAMGRARRAIEALAALAPKTALVRRGGDEVELLVERLEVGDVVVVRPNDRLPADGIVVSGQSSVDQAPVTGESVPVDKRPVDDPDEALRVPDRVPAEHRVFAGTINGAGALDVAVTRRAEDNTLSRVVQMVQEAETQRSPTQRFTDRFERVFVPAVLVLVAVLLLGGFVVDEPFGDTFYRAMAVLVAASPCALAISTPSAVLSGVARAARGGVLIKGGAPLERLGTLTAIAFDKTGTLTEGRPRLTDVVAADGASERELLAVAVAIERHSDHPLAAAVARDGAQRVPDLPTLDVEDLRAITGRGVQGRVEGRFVHLGKAALFGEVDGPPLPATVRDADARLAEQGRTTMILRDGDRYLGVLGLMDTPRPEAAPAIARLRELGVRRTIMISGDNQRVADAVAGQVGLDEAWGDLMPEDKVTAIRRLSAEAGHSAMVGDGVNDAPAMANATVGIAMGAAGSDVALETADIALMSDRLSQLPFATGLSRRTSAIIKQNLFISLGIVVVLIPATILGLGIGPAVLLHEGSTLIVVGNALRLLAYRDERQRG